MVLSVLKGLGKAYLKAQGKKVASKVVKRIKEDAPFVGAIGGVMAGRHVYKKLKGQLTDYDEYVKLKKEKLKRRREEQRKPGNQEKKLKD